MINENCTVLSYIPLCHSIRESESDFLAVLILTVSLRVGDYPGVETIGSLGGRYPVPTEGKLSLMGEKDNDYSGLTGKCLIRNPTIFTDYKVCERICVCHRLNNNNLLLLLSILVLSS